MDEKKKIFVVEIEDDVVKQFEEKKKKPSSEDNEFPPVSYQYEQYSLDELIILAKADSEACEEVLMRTLPTMQIYCRSVCSSKSYLPYSDLFERLQKATCDAIRIYDEKKGVKFSHLLRRMYQLSAKNFIKTEAIRYNKEKMLCSVDNKDVDMLADSGVVENDFKEDVIYKVDKEEFEKTLDDKEKQIMNLYYHGYSIRDIAERVHMPSSTVAYKMYKVVERAKKFFEGSK